MLQRYLFFFFLLRREYTCILYTNKGMVLFFFLFFLRNTVLSSWKNVPNDFLLTFPSHSQFSFSPSIYRPVFLIFILLFVFSSFSITSPNSPYCKIYVFFSLLLLLFLFNFSIYFRMVYSVITCWFFSVRKILHRAQEKYKCFFFLPCYIFNPYIFLYFHIGVIFAYLFIILSIVDMLKMRRKVEW